VKGQVWDLTAELTKKVSDSVSIPVIACGGAGKLDDIQKIITAGHADAVSLASMLHYDFIENRAIKGDYTDEGNIEYLKSGKKFAKMQLANLEEIKDFLYTQKINCRKLSGKGTLNASH